MVKSTGAKTGDRLPFMTASLQEELVHVRAVNLGMTTNTLPKRREIQPAMGHIGCERINVALQAQKPALGPQDQMIFNGSVREMTCRAAFNADGRMFVHPWPALVGVAADADLEVYLPQLRSIQRPVGSMAIRALHVAFRDAVVVGQRKLSLHRTMAREAEIRLALFEKTLVQPACLIGQNGEPEKLLLRWPQLRVTFIRRRYQQVCRMALLAGNASELVLRAMEQTLVLAGRVTNEAARRVLLRFASEAVNQLLTRISFLRVAATRRHHCVSVRFPGSVAGLATRSEFGIRRVSACVHCFGELSCFILMAG